MFPRAWRLIRKRPVPTRRSRNRCHRKNRAGQSSVPVRGVIASVLSPPGTRAVMRHTKAQIRGHPCGPSFTMKRRLPHELAADLGRYRRQVRRTTRLGAPVGERSFERDQFDRDDTVYVREERRRRDVRMRPPVADHCPYLLKSLFADRTPKTSRCRNRLPSGNCRGLRRRATKAARATPSGPCARCSPRSSNARRSWARGS